jgi:hypothetical protein
MNLAINSKIARNIIVVVINIKTKCLKITKKPSKMSKSQGWWRGWGGCGYYWLISPGFYSQSLKVAHRACSSAMEREVTRLHTVRLNIK